MHGSLKHKMKDDLLRIALPLSPTHLPPLGSQLVNHGYRVWKLCCVPSEVSSHYRQTFNSIIPTHDCETVDMNKAI